MKARARRSGFVLMAALWLLVALGAVGLDAALRSRSGRLAAANVLDEGRVRGAAFAGAEYARSRLTGAMLGRAEELRQQTAAQARQQALQRSGRPAATQSRRSPSVSELFRGSDPALDPWRDPARLLLPELPLSAATVTLGVRDAGAALNPNTAGEDMLRQFLAQGLRVDYARADWITQAILDWRDQDDIPRVGGGEREQYLKEGAAVLPANQPFASIEEVRHVRGMTAEIFEELRPYLGIVTSGRINVNSAPEPVLAALPGMTAAAAAVVVRNREAGVMPRSLDELLAILPGSARNAVLAERERFDRNATYVTSEVEITSDARIEGSPVAARMTVVVTRSETGAVVVWRRME